MKKLNLLLVILFVSTSCNTVKITNIDICAVAGKLQHGGVCAETLTEATYDLSFEEYIKFLEPDEETKKGPAISMSSAHFAELKTSLEQACKSLGSSCAPEVMLFIEKSKVLLNKIGVENDR